MEIIYGKGSFYLTLSVLSLRWLQDIVVCACVSSPELQAARALCHAHLPAQVSDLEYDIMLLAIN